MALSRERVRPDEEAPRVAMLRVRHGVHLQRRMPVLQSCAEIERRRDELERLAAIVERQHILPTAGGEEEEEGEEE